ncbi:MAG: bifunctional methylenetetrahydrofolate dehydrogenase/methenyltetrahydrofolate cyclohydrolase FolD [Planctomycetota bacterium]
MGARILDGKATAKAVRAEVAERVARLAAGGLVPGLTVVLVGDDPASQVYVRNKDKAATEAGFRVDTLRLPATTSQGELVGHVQRLNADDAVHGILVQLPLPAGLDDTEVLHAIDPRKDVDGLHRSNVGNLWRGDRGLRPCTPSGCIELLDRHELPIESQHAVVLGRSQLVGKPMAALLLERNATVTVAHSRTRELPDLVRRADILVAAVGRAKMVRGDWIRPGAVVLDVGMNRDENGKLCGDVDFDAASGVAGAITPVPGGVGPMTIAMLLFNTAQAAAHSATATPAEAGTQG